MFQQARLSTSRKLLVDDLKKMRGTEVDSGEVEVRVRLPATKGCAWVVAKIDKLLELERVKLDALKVGLSSPYLAPI